MILLTLVAMMFVNRDVDIPATSLFKVSIVIMILLTVCSSYNSNTDISSLGAEEAASAIRVHTVISTIGYILRPCLILMEILIIQNKSKHKFLYAIPRDHQCRYLFHGAFRKPYRFPYRSR